MYVIFDDYLSIRAGTQLLSEFLLTYMKFLSIKLSQEQRTCLGNLAHSILATKSHSNHIAHAIQKPTLISRL